MTSQIIDLEFENREYELGRIANPTGPRFIVVDAPPGYGKTYLLEKVRKIYREEDAKLKADWVCVLVYLDRLLKEQKGKKGNDHHQAIIDDIARQVDDTRTDNGTIQQLAAKIATGGMLLMLDAADYSEHVTKWLRLEAIPELDRRLKVRGKKVRAVFAGRYITKRGWEWPNYTTYDLDGFDDSIVQRMILGLKSDLDPSFASTLAQEVYFLSGGHPDCIKDILRVFADPTSCNWALDLDPEGHLRPEEERRRLYEDYGDKILDEILSHVKDKNTRTALKTLSVFRRFNVNTIQALQTSAAGEMIPNSLDPGRLLTQLTDTALVRPSIPDDPFYSDAIVRSLILVQMQFTDRPRYAKLNELAYKLYDAWVDSKNLDGKALRGPVLGQEQVTYMVEGFYHFLYCEDDKHRISISDIETKLRSYPPRLLSAFESPMAILELQKLFRDSIRNDKRNRDIHRRLHQLIGQAKTGELLDRVLP